MTASPTRATALPVVRRMVIGSGCVVELQSAPAQPATYRPALRSLRGWKTKAARPSGAHRICAM